MFKRMYARRGLWSLAIALILVLTGCFEGVISHETRITGPEGAGTRSIEIRVYRDGALSPDNSGNLVDGNRNFLPGGGEAAYDAVAAAKPAEWTWLAADWVTAEEEGRTDYDSIRVQLQFDSLADYNSKGAQVAGAMPFIPAELYSQGDELIYREALANVRSELEWILAAIYGEDGENPGVFSASQGGLTAPITKDEMIKYLEVRVNLMGETVTLHPPYDVPGQYITVIHPLNAVNTERPDYSAVPVESQDLAVREQDRGDFPISSLRVSREDRWTELFNRRSGWIGADGIFSIPLDGRDQIGDGTASTKTFFTFADTTLGQADDHLLQFRLGWRMVNQSAAILTGTEPDPANIEFFYNQDPVTGLVSNLYPNSAKTWPSDGIRIGNSIIMLAQTVDDAMNPLGIQEIRVPLTGDRPDFANSELVPRPDLYFNQEDAIEITFTNGIFDNTAEAGAPEPDGYLYVYGYRNIRAEALKQMVVARVPKQEFSDPAAWEFYNQGVWADTIDQLNHSTVSLADHVSPENSITYISEGPFTGKYLLIYQHDTISPYVVMRTADSLLGPFSEPQWLYTIPEQAIYDNLPAGETITYNTKAHPHLSEPGSLLLSYNVNTWFALPASTEIYRPRFLKLDLTGQTESLLDYNPEYVNVLSGLNGTASHSQETAHFATDSSESPGLKEAWEPVSLEAKSLQFDLGANHTLDRWRVHHASSAGLPTVYNTRDYALLTSLDGVNWNLADRVEYNHAAYTDRVFSPQEARYVRFEVLDDAQSDEPAARIFELEVFGAASPLTPTPEPTATPTPELTPAPTEPPLSPTPAPTEAPLTPSPAPTEAPLTPSPAPTEAPLTPSPAPTEVPLTPTPAPTEPPLSPSPAPTEAPLTPSPAPTEAPLTPSPAPTEAPLTLTPEPTATPTPVPTATPTPEPTATPTPEPAATPTLEPTATPTEEPTDPTDPSELPKTGEGRSIQVAAGITILLLAGAASVLFVLRKKRRR